MSFLSAIMSQPCSAEQCRPSQNLRNYMSCPGTAGVSPNAIYFLASIPKLEATTLKAGHGRMHTENTGKELSVFSVCIFSAAGMCTK